MKSFYLLFFCLAWSFNLTGQYYPSFNKYWEPITEAIQADNHFEAYELMQQALAYQQMTDTLHYLSGISAWKQNAYGKAENHFRKLLSSDFESRHLDINYYLGEIAYSTGRYGEASNFFKVYLAQLDPGTKELDLTEQRIKQTTWAKEHQDNKDPLIKIRRVETGINTAFNESSPYIMDDYLYFSRIENKNTNKSKGQKDYSTIVRVREKDGQMDSTKFPLTDTKMFSVNPSFSNDKKLFLFTVCNPQESTTQLNCQIYYRRLDENNKWSVIKKFPEQINMSGYNSTQACAVLEEEGIYRIYYSSNRPQGKGGMDLWTVLLNEDGSCSSPENLENLNTLGDEYSPHFAVRTKTLFFSSNHHLGYGGFDIYKYSYKGKDSLTIINLGRSVNSSYDEITYSTRYDEQVAYLSSNRPGSTYLDQNLQACCFDIYKVTITPKTVDLLVTIRDRYDSLEISGARVSLYEIIDGKDSLITTAESSEQSSYIFKLIEGRKYKVVANKSIYLGDSTQVTTIDLYSYDPIKRNLYLIQKKELNAFTFERTTNFILKGATVQLLDLTDNKVVDQFTKVDTNYFHFNILKGHDYRLIAAKPKYEPDTVDITAIETSRENVLNRKLFLELSAIAELRRLLPIRLFFDNDIPNPRSESDTTEVHFSKIYDDYVAKKGVYMSQYANVLKGLARAKAISEIDTFFNIEVKRNGDKLLVFLDKLSIIMDEGHTIDIFLKGYASPRAKSDYNQHLSSRRVTSIRNEFDTYRQGVFHPYISNGNLKIKEIPFGESLSATDVSDSLEDTRNSIYSLKAAFERRVEILEILKGVDDVQQQ